MTRAVDAFVAEVRANPDLAVHADAVADAFHAVDLEGDGNRNAVAFFEGLLWIIRQPVDMAERVRALHELAAFKGEVVVNLRRDGERIIVKEL
jgi:hypothetical protein